MSFLNKNHHKSQKNQLSKRFFLSMVVFHSNIKELSIPSKQICPLRTKNTIFCVLCQHRVPNCKCCKGFETLRLFGTHPSNHRNTRSNSSELKSNVALHTHFNTLTRDTQNVNMIVSPTSCPEICTHPGASEQQQEHDTCTATSIRRAIAKIFLLEFYFILLDSEWFHCQHLPCLASPAVAATEDSTSASASATTSMSCILIVK